MSFDLLINQGDLAIGQDGDLAKVEDNNKLIQDLLKMIVTPLGSNKLYPLYGCLVNKSLIGQAYFDIELLTNVATSQLQNSIDTLQKLQQKQMVEQKVSPGELIAATKSVSVQRSDIDPRFFTVALEIATKALNVITTEFSIKPNL